MFRKTIDYNSLSREEKRKYYKCGNNYVTVEYLKNNIWSNYKPNKTSTSIKHRANSELNDKIALWQGDSTRLEIDAIVNAANNSLLGGGGIDGAIHSAAGSQLRSECAKLNGCSTGDAKVSNGHRLPAKKIIHAVGPMGENAELLKSAYHSCLEQAKINKLKTIGFCCISTGIFGYPLESATHVALDTVRKWLDTEDNAKSIDLIIFVVFLRKELECYKHLLPQYFPHEHDPQSDEKSEAYQSSQPNETEEEVKERTEPIEEDKEKSKNDNSETTEEIKEEIKEETPEDTSKHQEENE